MKVLLIAIVWFYKENLMPHALSMFASLLCAIVLDMEEMDYVMEGREDSVKWQLPYSHPVQISSRNDACTVRPACSYYLISCSKSCKWTETLSIFFDYFLFTARSKLILLSLLLLGSATIQVHAEWENMSFPTHMREHMAWVSGIEHNTSERVLTPSIECYQVWSDWCATLNTPFQMSTSIEISCIYLISSIIANHSFGASHSPCIYLRTSSIKNSD